MNKKVLQHILLNKLLDLKIDFVFKHPVYNQIYKEIGEVNYE